MGELARLVGFEDGAFLRKYDKVGHRAAGSVKVRGGFNTGWHCLKYSKWWRKGFGLEWRARDCS